MTTTEVDLDDLRPLVAAMVRQYGGPAHDIDDLLQDTWLSLQRVTFDPARGDWPTLCRVVARRRVHDYYRRTASHGAQCNGGKAESLEALTAVRGDSAVGGHVDDDTRRVEAADELRQVFGVLHLVQDTLGINRDRVEHFLRLHLIYDGDTTAASTALGVSAHVLRASSRDVIAFAQVIRAALEAPEDGSSIVATVASVPGTIGRHAPAYLGAAREAGGVTAVDAHALATVTGTRFNTVRQYWARVRDLARVAAWTFDHQGRPATDRHQLFPGGL
ncbi:sigma-70 family RNA polymerase sigma factor [Citricoccus sp. SGAir0253]|uniref:sigma factor n=1 Tax=Citricoccus sp. SGAir0253 TaxID=2567881 RepID=UPI0010CCDF26|nr:sigma factor [Citricoccus sp. SGAir0253]QCU78675.1 sigma-70 family RNA polymerase sigma factor [Citricoccus sp. SGAir0253]